MDVRYQLPDQPPARPAAVTFGNFDGVHIGHQALLSAIRRAAEQLGGPSTVVTFDPHPLAVLRPEGPPPAVDTLATRLELLRGQAIDRVIVLRFDEQLAAQSAQWFAYEVLCQRLHGRHFVTGPGVRFGHRGAGDLALLRQAAESVGGTVEPFAGVVLDGAIVSSSRVRQAVAAGEAETAARLLGRPFCLRGTVVHGDARGRTIGFPTANLLAPGQIQPAHGVYACLAEVAGQWHDAVTNVGVRPTFVGTQASVEAHLLNWQGDLYDQDLQLHFVARLRAEQRFAGLDALIAQIHLDVIAARTALDAWRAEALTP